MMPVMDGYECIQHIRKNEKMADAFICSLTANATTHEREKCLALGANSFFTKPININALEALFVERFGQPVISAENQIDRKEEKLQSLPEKLPGLDISKALAQLGGREEIFLKVISAFIFEYGDSKKIEAQMSNFLSKQMDVEAKRLAHTIKGVSGSIGATELQEAAIQLEMALHENKQLDGKLTLFWGHFNITLSSCNRVNQLSQN